MELAPREAYRRHTRLDAGYLALLAEGFERDPSLRDALRFVPSSGLYEAAGKLRHAEGTTDLASRERSYELVAVGRTPHLDATLARAAGGARPPELARALVADDPELDLEEASSFVQSLVTSQILTSDVAPTATGREPLGVIIDGLRAAGVHGRAPARVLDEAGRAMRALDDGPFGAPPEHYRAIAKPLDALPADVDIARLFQVDLHKPAPHATLGGAALRTIEDAIALLARIAQPAASDAMRRFREAFVARYGPAEEGPLAARRRVPLCEALDDETGLGFGGPNGRSSPLLEGLRFASDASATTPFGKRERTLLRRTMEILRAGGNEWILTDADLEALAPAVPAKLPDSFAFMGSLAAASSDALANGDLRLLVESMGGSSAAMLLGRFCHGDPELHRAVEVLVRAEEAHRPDAIFAEIVHVPEGRLGNILARPSLREYEIPYLGRASAPPERQLPVADLDLVLDRGHFVLFSKRLGREVIPRLTNAHNYGTSRFAIYRFLCELQHGRDRHAFGWDWDPLLDAPFLPRVSRGNVVLALARWTVSKEELSPLAKACASDRFRLVQELRRRRDLPRWIVLTDGDRTLPIDLEHAVSVAALVASIARREGAVLTELFPAPDELVAFGPEGHFVHQLVVPFVRRASGRPPPPGEATRQRTPVSRRAFGPGSSYLAVKLFTGVVSADDVLTDLVAPLVARARRAKTISRWFFERDASPEAHVRLVLSGDGARLAKLLPRLDEAAAPLLADGRLRRIAIDTHERESERYGGDEGMDLAEALFEADSDAVLALLERLETAEERWHLVLRGCHDLLVDLGLDLAERLAVVERAHEGARTDKALEQGLGIRFREHRKALTELLAAAADGDHPLAPGLEVLEVRSERIRPIVRALREHEREGRLGVPVRDQAARYLRMHMSRLVRSDLREHGIVLHDFLRRLYISEAARSAGAEARRA